MEKKRFRGSYCAAINCNDNKSTRPDLSYFRFQISVRSVRTRFRIHLWCVVYLNVPIFAAPHSPVKHGVKYMVGLYARAEGTPAKRNEATYEKNLIYRPYG